MDFLDTDSEFDIDKFSDSEKLKAEVKPVQRVRKIIVDRKKVKRYGDGEQRLKESKQRYLDSNENIHLKLHHDCTPLYPQIASGMVVETDIQTCLVDEVKAEDSLSECISSSLTMNGIDSEKCLTATTIILEGIDEVLYRIGQERVDPNNEALNWKDIIELSRGCVPDDVLNRAQLRMQGLLPPQ